MNDDQLVITALGLLTVGVVLCVSAMVAADKSRFRVAYKLLFTSIALTILAVAVFIRMLTNG